MSKFAQRTASSKLAGVAVLLAAGGAANAQHVFWGDNGNLAPSPGFTGSIFLRDENVAAVDQFLAGQAVRAVKIDLAVSPATLAAIYDKYKVDYTFLDYEGVDAFARTTATVNQIKASAGTGPAVINNQAFVGNFGLAPISADRTAPGMPNTAAAYVSTGVNMASEQLYPGSPGFRGPASGDSTAPNVRSALFTLPIERLSLTTANLPAGHAHVAYVDRFNNYQNAALDTDGDPTNGQRFVTQDQLLSRGDFKAQVLHYRLRGATAVHGLQGGVEGYTPAQFQGDIHEGWSSNATVNALLADPKVRFATLDTRVKVDGVAKALEDAGVAWSGVYSGASGKLVMLLSNLDATAHTVTFPASIGGKAVAGEYVVQAGSHEILEFGAAGSKWNLVSETAVFVDNDRAGVGVPEPTALALAGVGLALGLRRNRRRR